MVMKKSHSGVGRAFSKMRRYREDEEYREKRRQYRRDYDKRHRERIQTRERERIKQLTEFANKRCKICNKLLDYRTKSRFCREHHPKWKKKNLKKQK